MQLFGKWIAASVRKVEMITLRRAGGLLSRLQQNILTGFHKLKPKILAQLGYWA
jgi:hypothetical protein